MKQLARRAAALVFAFLLTAGLNVGAFAVGTMSAEITSFDACVSGGKLVLSFKGSTWYHQGNDLTVRYADGSSETYMVIVSNGGGEASVRMPDWSRTVAEGSADYYDGANFTAEVSIPLSEFKSTDFTLDFLGGTMSSDEMGFGGSAEPETPEGPERPEQPETPEGPEQPETPEGPELPETPEEPEMPEPPEEAETPAQPETAPAQSETSASGMIVVDGDPDDWAAVPALISSDSYIEEWKTARDAAGNVYLMFTGTASTQWDWNFQWKQLKVTQNGNDTTVQFATQTIGTVEMQNHANGNTPAPYCVEMMIPASYFTDPNFRLALGNDDVSASSMPALESLTPVEKPKRTVYDGIVIDGEFSDWDPVTKATAKDSNAVFDDLDEAAMVFDGAYIYIYLKETYSGSANNAGTHGNGLYAVTTDLNRRLLFQLRGLEEVRGPEGASAKHVGKEWEIVIPASDLPTYLNTISFGLYMNEPMVSDLANRSGKGSGGSFNGVQIDGSYGDWEYYPTSLIEYATQGTQAIVQDSYGSLYAEGSTLYGHVFTNMPAHIAARGGDFLAAISVAFNGDRDHKALPELGNFYPMMFRMDGAGNITVVNEGERLAPGTYRYFISDTRNTLDYDQHREEFMNTRVFGEMFVTVNEEGSGKGDEMEFWLDLEKIAQYTGMDAGDLKLIEAQFGRLGRQWITTAGASSGAWPGIALSCAAVLGVAGYRRRRGEKTA